MTEPLNKILEFEEQLNSVNTDNVEPMAHAVPLNNVMREDVVEESMPIREAMLNAPDEVEGFCRVPRVIERDLGGWTTWDILKKSVLELNKNFPI